MKGIVSAIVVAATFLISGASAQMVVPDLSGRYRCVTFCAAGAPGGFAYITQYGRELGLVDDVGTPWRAYIERPGRIWVHRLQQSAIYSADGAMIQFERGTVWQRDVVEVPVPRPGTSPAPIPRATPYDGDWRVTIVTQAGPCDPQFNFGARIIGGTVIYPGGGPVNLQGQVGPDGAIQVSVSAGGGRADGEGRMLTASGSGTWRGQGGLGMCSGTWQAARMG